MRLTIESTDKITRIDGVPCRVWEGTTPGGNPVIVFVHRLAARVDRDRSELEAELLEQLLPAELVPLRQALEGGGG